MIQETYNGITYSEDDLCQLYCQGVELEKVELVVDIEQDPSLTKLFVSIEGEGNLLLKDTIEKGCTLTIL